MKHITEFEEKNPSELRPSDIREVRSSIIGRVVDEEIVVFLYSIYDSYIATMLMFETKLKSQSNLGKMRMIFYCNHSNFLK